MTQVELQTIAQSCKECAGSMSLQQLDSWYVEHIGYSLAEDDPEAFNDHRATAALVAGVMFFLSCPEGADTPFAEAIEAELCEAIKEDRPLLF